MSEHTHSNVEQEQSYEIPPFLDVYRDNPRGLPDTWGAVPLVNTRPILEQQQAIDTKLRKLFRKKQRPKYVNNLLGDYIETVHLARAQHRLMRNRDSFAYRANYKASVPFELLDVASAAIDGSASPAELLYMRQFWRMPSVELGSLTHPYGKRMKPHLEDMRDAVDGAINLHGGTLYETEAERMNPRDKSDFLESLVEYEVKGTDESVVHGESQPHGIHMTRKSRIGSLPDGTEVVERSSFIIRCEALPDALQRAVQSIQDERMYRVRESASEEDFTPWTEEMMRIPGFLKHVAGLLSNDDHEAAIPVSTTVVAMHAGDLDAYESLDSDTKQKRMLEHAQSKSFI